MRTRALVLAAAAALIVVSSGAAAPPLGKGKPPVSGVGCKPLAMVLLKGTLASSPGAAPVLPYSLQVKLSSANRFGDAFVKAGQPISVTVTGTTKITRNGGKVLSRLVSGDRLVIEARGCQADLAAGAVPPLTATHVTAHPASS
jgi:hypothetical protein